MPIALAVDGGITPDTAPHVVAAGADTLIAGTAVFGPDYRGIGLRAVEAARHRPAARARRGAATSADAASGRGGG